MTCYSIQHCSEENININQKLNSQQKTPHTLPSGVSHRVDRLITVFIKCARHLAEIKIVTEIFKFHIAGVRQLSDTV